MKKIMNIWLMAALVCGLSLSVTSCKDDDDDSKSEEQLQQEQAEKASKFWSVVGQLVSSDSYEADYADKTFEPTYGIADATNETTRIVETNDMQTAAQRFADLVGASIDENTPTYTYSDPEVGTLAYTRSGTAAEWASVDVNIKQLPRLRKIIYRQGGEGTNGNFAGKAYYRFGDVVSRTLADGQKEYWICVRPAFGPEKKGDSHWVCLNYLPAKNIFNYAYQSKSWTVPTGIGKDKENMQNLAEMLYAMCNPQEWDANANNLHTDGKLWGFSGLPIFADFSKANVMYHNQYFWQKVADAWEKNKIAERAMNIDMGVLYDIMYRGHQGLHLLYEGYSWWTKTSWNCTLYEASYTNGQKNEEKNLHHAEYKEVKKRMEDIKFDCTLMGAATDNYMQFFDNDRKYRWVVRHATGADLNGGKDPSPTAPLQGAGVKTEYRYYDEYEDEWLRKGPNGKSGHPEVTVNGSDTRCYYHVGDVVRYKNRLYICATDHYLNEEARFVTLNDQDDHTIGTFNWSGTGKDSVYNDDMASSKTLYQWTKNVLFNKERTNSVRAALQAKGIAGEQWNQVVPQTDQMGFQMQYAMMDPYHLIVDITKGSVDNNVLNGAFKATQHYNVVYWECQGNEYDQGFDPEDEDNIRVYSIAPGGYLLADKMRYSEHATSSWDQWVPYLYLIRDDQMESYRQALDARACMSTLSPSHFKWADLGTITITEKIVEPHEHSWVNSRGDLKAGTYHVLLLAFYWQHNKVRIGLSYWRLLMNFTHDRKVNAGVWATPDYTWYRRCITSREYVVTDDGKKNSKLESVAVQKEQ